MNPKSHSPLVGLLALVFALVACSSTSEPSTQETTSTTTSTPTSVSESQPVATVAPAAEFEPELGLHGVDDPVIPAAGAPGIDVDHYDLNLDLTDNGFEAVATIDGTVTDPGLAQISLDLVGLEVSDVTMNGAETDFHQTDSELLIPNGSNPSFTLTISYGGTPTPTPAGVGVATDGWIDEDWGSYVVSEPVGAHTWFPSNDHPSDKATFTIEVTVDEGITVVGPGPLVAPEGNAFRFVPTEPMAPYLASISVGSFNVTETTGSSGVPIKIALPDNQADELTGQIPNLDTIISFYEEVAGPYPFDSYGIVAIPTQIDFALENQTMSLFDINGVSSDELQAHELAHQWFGDNVSVASWEDIWLNEGFATWMQYWWTNEGQMSKVDPLLEDIPPEFLGPIIPTEPAEMFSTSVYVRGGLTLEALRRTIGHGNFVALLAEWTARYGGGNASTQDFLDLVEELEGKEAAESTSRWIHDEIAPALPDPID